MTEPDPVRHCARQPGARATPSWGHPGGGTCSARLGLPGAAPARIAVARIDILVGALFTIPFP